MLDRALLTFLMESFLAGRLDRRSAHILVSPWVEGDAPMEPGAEGGAMILHGLDLVVGRDSNVVWHAGIGESDFMYSDDELADRCRAWLDRQCD